MLVVSTICASTAMPPRLSEDSGWRKRVRTGHQNPTKDAQYPSKSTKEKLEKRQDEVKMLRE